MEALAASFEALDFERIWVEGPKGWYQRRRTDEERAQLLAYIAELRSR